VKEINQDP